VKLDTSGNIEWQKCFGGSSIDQAQGNSIEQTSDGGFIVAGFTHSSDGDITLNHGYYDSWIIKLDTAGNKEWQKCYGGSINDYAYAARQLPDGDYVVSGLSNSNDGDATCNMYGVGEYWIFRLSTATGVEVRSENTETLLVISPNPASHFFNLEFRLPDSEILNAAITITITNLLGQTVLEKNARIINRQLEEAIDLNETIKEGVYLVKVKGKEQQWTAPLIVSK
jgi:hypothetical protein